MSAPSLLLLALAVAVPTDEMVQRQGQIEARLRIDVPDEGVEPGRARVRIDVVVVGPEGLQIAGPRLEDSRAAWRITRRTSSWREEDGQCVIATSMTLEQVAPGVMQLPGVVLLARQDDATAWRQLSWPDLLREPREGTGIEVTPPLPAPRWPGLLGVVSLGVAVALAVLLLVRRLSRRRPRPVPAHVRALAYLAEANVSPARAELVVRDFLDERFGLSTRRQTGREMLAACANLPDQAREALEELASRAERVKFAGVVPDESERLGAIELARRVIDSCSAVAPGQEGQGEENRYTGAGG